MNRLIYIIGLVVVVVAVLAFFGFRWSDRADRLGVPRPRRRGSAERALRV